MSLNVASGDENVVNPNEGAQKVKERNIGSVLNRRRKYLQEQKQHTSTDENLDHQENTTITSTVAGVTKKGWQDDEETTNSANNKEQKGGRRLLGIFGGKSNNSSNINEKPQQTDNAYIFQNVPRPLDGDEEVNAIDSIPSVDQKGIPGLDQTVADAPEEYASQKVQTLQELDQTTKATLHHFLNMKYDDRGLDLSLLTGALSYPLDELEQDEDWSNPQFVRDLLNSIKGSKKETRNTIEDKKTDRNLKKVIVN